MRPVAIVALLLASLAGLAFVPTSAAAPPAPACNGTIGGTTTLGPVSVFVSPPCYVVSVDAGCPVAASDWRSVTVQGVTVRVKTCDPAAEEASQAPPCVCPPPPVCTPISTVGPLVRVVSVSVSSSCDVRVDLLSGYQCVSPLDERTVVTQGRITVTAPCEPEVEPCEPPLDCYPAAASSLPLALCESPGLCNDAGCPYPVGAERGTDLQAGPAHVTHACGPQDVCSGPMGCTNPLGSASAASPAVLLIPPVCIEREVAFGPVRAGFDQCRGDHETSPCYSPQRIHRYEQVGPVWAQVHVCFPHSPPPDLAAASAAPSPLPSDLIRIVRNADGTVDVFVKADVMDCLWGEGYQKTASAGPVTVWTWGCNPPYPPDDVAAASAAPPRPCGAADPTQRCPAPVPLCSGVQDQPPLIDVSSNCHVTVDTTALVSCYVGHTEARTVGPVTVKYPVCEPPCGGATCPPPMEAAMADPFPTCIRECSPVPSEGCGLQEATPTTVGPTALPFNPRAFLWGADCDVDVEPIGACAPPSGSTKEIRIAFLHVTLLLCDGGLPPAWG